MSPAPLLVLTAKPAAFSSPRRSPRLSEQELSRSENTARTRPFGFPGRQRCQGQPGTGTGLGCHCWPWWAPRGCPGCSRCGALRGMGGAGSAACRQTPDALAAASLEGEMNSLLPSSVFSPEHLHSNWEIWAFSCFSARSCQPFPLPKRGLVVFFFSLPAVACAV